MKKLTAKQKIFVAEYLKDFNATRAAIDAGYSKKTAEVQGYQLLQKTLVQEAIAAATEKRLDKLEITSDRVLQELARIGFFDIRKLFDENGNLKPISEIDDDTAAAIAGIEVEVKLGAEEPDEELEPQPHGGALKRQRAITSRLHKIKFVDKKGSLELLGKHLKLFTDKVEHTGPNGGPIQAVTMTPEEFKAAAAEVLEKF